MLTGTSNQKHENGHVCTESCKMTHVRGNVYRHVRAETLTRTNVHGHSYTDTDTCKRKSAKGTCALTIVHGHGKLR
jgi:hypothetical protein